MASLRSESLPGFGPGHFRAPGAGSVPPRRHGRVHVHADLREAAQRSAVAFRLRRQASPCSLHVYDLGSDSCGTINACLRPLGTGFFHCGVEVYGWEWSYSWAGPHESALEKLWETGVFCVPPKTCEGHAYSQTVIVEVYG